MNPTGLTLNFFSRMFSSKGAHSLIKQDSDDEDKDPDENTSMLESLNETNSDQRSSGTPNSVKKQHRTHEISSKSKSESLLMQRSTSEEDLDLEIVKLASKKRGSNSKGWFAPTGNSIGLIDNITRYQFADYGSLATTNPGKIKIQVASKK